MATPKCQKFAESVARVHGMSYDEATKKYPRGPVSKSVYMDDKRFEEDHCVHCARVQAILKNEEEQK